MLVFSKSERRMRTSQFLESRLANHQDNPRSESIKAPESLAPARIELPSPARFGALAAAASSELCAHHDWLNCALQANNNCPIIRTNEVRQSKSKDRANITARKICSRAFELSRGFASLALALRLIPPSDQRVGERGVRAEVASRRASQRQQRDSSHGPQQALF